MFISRKDSSAITRMGVFASPATSYADFLSEKWSVLSRELGVHPAETRAAVAELRELIRPWGDRLIGSTPAIPSYVADDGFPAEVSVSWRGPAPEIRVLVESLGAEPTMRGAQEAGQALTRRLRSTPGVRIDEYLKVEDLFLADDPAPNRPTVWHSLAWQPGGGPGTGYKYKVYLNPQARGADRSYEMVGEAMSRLGMDTAWSPIEHRAAELAERGHELEFVALDLADPASARLKVYFRHGEMPPSEIDTVAGFARRHDPERAARARRIVYGGDGGTVANQPMTCLAFRHGAEGAEEANVYLRLPDDAGTDADATGRISAVLRGEGLDPARYLAAISALAPNLNSIVGLQELLSYRTMTPGSPADVGVYLRFSAYARPAAEFTPPA